MLEEEEELPTLPKELEDYLDAPYGGLFGNTVIANLVEEIIADPFSTYRQKELEDLLDVSTPAIRKALNTLVRLGLLEKDNSDKQHPIYTVNKKTKKYTALTLLAYAILDDRNCTDSMDAAIKDYCDSELSPQYEPYVMIAKDNLNDIYDAIYKIQDALHCTASLAPIVIVPDKQRQEMWA